MNFKRRMHLQREGLQSEALGLSTLRRWLICRTCQSLLCSAAHGIARPRGAAHGACCEAHCGAGVCRGKAAPRFTIAHGTAGSRPAPGAQVGGADLDYQFAYVVGYANRPGGPPRSCPPRPCCSNRRRRNACCADGTPNVTRSALVPHTDDSEVTLNVCLGTQSQRQCSVSLHALPAGAGRRFAGGQLVMRGLRGEPHEVPAPCARPARARMSVADTCAQPQGEHEARLQPRPGHAVLHLGQHLHEVTPVTRGQRFALIMWCRSSAFRSKWASCTPRSDPYRLTPCALRACAGRALVPAASFTDALSVCAGRCGTECVVT